MKFGPLSDVSCQRFYFAPSGLRRCLLYFVINITSNKIDNVEIAREGYNDSIAVVGEGEQLDER